MHGRMFDPASKKGKAKIIMWAEICEEVKKNSICQEATLAASNVSNSVSKTGLHRTLGFHKMEVKIRVLQAYSTT